MAELSPNWKKLQEKLQKSGQAAKATSERKCDMLAPRPSRARRASSSILPGSRRHSARRRSSAVMGAVQSSNVTVDIKQDQTASLEVWAADNDISSETLAEAYGLGLDENSMMMASLNDKVNHGLSLNIEIGKYVSLDCEMVGVGPGGYESALARVSLVDFHGRQIFDSYVRPRERVTDWRTSVSGVSTKTMRYARDFVEVQSDVSDILKGRILIGHDVKHDLNALDLSHPPKDTRDTAKHPLFRKHGHGRKPALRLLARELLGIEVQQGSHSSTEDARVTMLLFRKFKPSFDVDCMNRCTRRGSATSEKRRGARRKKHEA